MNVKNRPDSYVKRTELPESVLHVKNRTSKPDRAPKVRDFDTADIDANFYFTFPVDPMLK